MRGQIQVLVAGFALALTALFTVVLFMNIYAYTTSYRATYSGGDVYSVIKEKPYWTACNLSETLLDRLGAVNVTVSILERKLDSTGSIVRNESCTASTETRRGTGFTQSYTYTLGTVYGTVVIYTVEVKY